MTRGKLEIFAIIALLASPAAGRVRPAVHAGTWYPAEPEVLRERIEALLEQAGPAEVPGEFVALVGPHAGLRYSGRVAAHGYRLFRERPARRVILIGPSHYASFEGVALPAPDVDAYATPLGELPLDAGALGRLRGRPGFGGPASAHDPEHSLEMHAVFLAAVQPGVRLVPLVVGRLGGDDRVRALARTLRSILEPGDRVVVSCDFTHYGPRYGYVPFRRRVPEGLERLMEGAVEPLLRADLPGFTRHLRETGDTICGREPVRLLLALLPEGARGVRLAWDTSGRITGDYRNSVTYVTVAYGAPRSWAARAAPLGPGEQQEALRMARRALEIFLETGRVPDARALGVPDAPVWYEPRAVFVTLKRGHRLRGCIGHILPVQPLWQDLRDNAIAAAARDPRFPPVTREELDTLRIEVSVLTRPRPVPGPEGFVPGRHGVILEVGGRRAVFLPQVAVEQGWDREATLSHLARKAGLPPDAWRRPDARFQVFEAQVFGET